MSTYAVMRRRRQPGFKVEVVADDGSRHTILGFATEAADWAATDRQLERFQSWSVEADYLPGSLVIVAPQKSNG